LRVPQGRHQRTISRMPSSYVSVRVHCIWSTKNRLKLIPEDAQPRVWAYINQVGVNLGIKMLAVGGVENHVHVLFSLPPRGELAEAVQKESKLIALHPAGD
jgi:putative transposase